MSETTATVTELARELGRLREDFLEMREERDEARAHCAKLDRDVTILAGDLDEARRENAEMILERGEFLVLVEKAERERDEALGKCDSGGAAGVQRVTKRQMGHDSISDTDDEPILIWVSEWAELERERDEARRVARWLIDLEPENDYALTGHRRLRAAHPWLAEDIEDGP
jgi:hypothetical protein